MDIASRGLFPDNAKFWLERGVDLAIDHHPSNEGFGRENCVDPGRAACGELIYRHRPGVGPGLPRTVALPLYVAVSTDTGCFVYGNTTPHTHRVAAALMDTGIDYQWVNKRHFRTKSFKRLQLERMLTEHLELFDGGKMAVAAVTLAVMAALDAHEEDAEDIAAFAGQVEGVETSVTIRELRPGAASSPSAPPPGSTPRRCAPCWGAAATPLPPGALSPAAWRRPGPPFWTPSRKAKRAPDQTPEAGLQGGLSMPSGNHRH